MSSPSHGGAHASSSGGGGSLLSQLKRFDIYRTVPRDLTEQTTAGAAVSMLAAALVLVLFLSELGAFLRVDVRHETLVMQPGAAGTAAGGAEDDGMMELNFNITVPAMPCAITHVALNDMLGGHVDTRGDPRAASSADDQMHIRKWRTDAAGQLKFSLAPPHQALRGDLGSVNPRDQEGEGCNLEGRVRVRKVPGHLVFSSNADPSMLQMMFLRQMGAPGGDGPHVKGIGGNLNTSHHIHSFWFGDTMELSEVGEAALAPLNGGTKWSLATEVTNGNEKSYEYFIKVIPTQYQRLSGPIVSAYRQFECDAHHWRARARVAGLSAVPLYM